MQSTVNGSSIQTIIEMDKRARERVANAKKDAEEIRAEAEGKKKQLLSEYRSNSQKSLQELEKSCRNEADEEIGRINADRDKKTAELDRKLDQNRNLLMNNIFEAVTGCKRRA
ncbi:MAG TPA: hypothetical protein DDX91_00640 [Ruminococcaceae bacterium]|nr:hypothetical protein [Oscillospiraceae bacterium]